MAERAVTGKKMDILAWQHRSSRGKQDSILFSAAHGRWSSPIDLFMGIMNKKEKGCGLYGCVSVCKALEKNHKRRRWAMDTFYGDEHHWIRELGRIV